MLKQFVVLVFLLGFHGILGLKCRSEDGILDGDLKRVARVCMQRVSENNYRIGNNNRPPYGNRPRYGDDQYNNNNNYNNDQNYYNNNHDYSYNNNDRYDYDYMDMDRGWHEPRGDLLWQRNRQRWHNSNRKVGVHSTGNNGGNTGSGGSGNTGGNNANHHHRNSMSSSSSSGNNNNRNNNNNNGTKADSACISLCFFDEMKMLNRNNLPDRQKMNYLITKDIRNRELRNFYTDTIQECFRYMESQYRRDRCQYSQELIKCMAEYAKASCDDWEEYDSILFN